MMNKTELLARFYEYQRQGLLNGSQMGVLARYFSAAASLPPWIGDLAALCEARAEGRLDDGAFEAIKSRFFRNAQSPGDKVVHSGVINVHPVGASDASAPEAAKLVRDCALVAAFIGLVPLPMADAPFLIVTQFVMLRKLCSMYDRSPGLSLALIVLSALAGPMLFDALVKLFPVAGSIAGAAVAGALTWFIGSKVRVMLANGQDFTWRDFLRARIDWPWR